MQLVEQYRQPPPVDQNVVGGHQDRTRLSRLQQHPGQPGRIALGVDRADGQCRRRSLQGVGVGGGYVDAVDRQRGPVRSVDVLYRAERVDRGAQRLVTGGEEASAMWMSATVVEGGTWQWSASGVGFTRRGPGMVRSYQCHCCTQVSGPLRMTVAAVGSGSGGWFTAGTSPRGRRRCRRHRRRPGTPCSGHGRVPAYRDICRSRRQR